MKRKSFNPLILLAVVVLLVMGCSQGISKNKIIDALANEENCLKGCEPKEQAYFKAMAECIAGYLSQELYQQRLEGCGGNIECRGAIYGEISEKCLKETNELKQQWEECEKTCRDKFPLEVGVK